MKDWPTLPWYEPITRHTRDALVTMGWQIVHFGNWMVKTFHRGGGASGGSVPRSIPVTIINKTK